jgi:GntR family transcriptional regulator
VDRTHARLLGLAAGSPVMEVHRLALTFGDKPGEYRISTINTQAHDYVSVRAKRA